MSDILLIEPGYKSTYPPIGLMKIAYFHRYIHHDYVRFAKGRLPEAFARKKWDRVYVTTLFTFEWDTMKEALDYALTVVKPEGKVYTGGILATLMPNLISEYFPTIINNVGLLNHKGTLGLEGEECVDTLPLDYGILEDVKDEYTYPAHDAYFTYMTRGCGMNCTFCAVKTLEPTYSPYISITDAVHRVDREFGPKKDLLLMDNNVLRSPDFDRIVDEIKSLGFAKGATFKNPKTGKINKRYVDFNQGLDAFLMTPHKAKRLGELAIHPARIAFDHLEDKDVYCKAITLCAENGIEYMSNYLLYNGVDFTGKGHSYEADTPAGLYERMRITMELSENLTRRLGHKVSIFSFPMRYIPLDNLHRGFVGKYWNKKYLRAVQCMLIPTQGKGVVGRSFFEADFGKTEEEFVETLAMPEDLISKRGFWVERKKESEESRRIRRQIWEDNHQLIKVWRNLYRSIDKEKFLTYISDNHFDPARINEIQDSEMKKLYLLYFTVPGAMRVMSEADEDTRVLLKEFIVNEISVLYRKIVYHISSKNVLVSQLKSAVHAFGRQLIKDIIKTINIWDNNSRLFENLNKVSRSEDIKFDFALLKFALIYDAVDALDEKDKKIISEAAENLDAGVISKCLLDRIDLLKEKLVDKNSGQPGQDQIYRIIEDQVKGVYQQLSLFDENK